jgi:amidase
VSNELGYLSATEARLRFAEGSLDPETVVDALLVRAHAMTHSVNATTAVFRNEALQQARDAKRRYQSGTARALEAIPVAIKEETAVAGWPRTIGSKLIDETPSEHHPIVSKLIDAGAILHLQTTCPEFCLMPTTWSERFGVTRNPWNLEITAGGSSGGSAAALAAGLTMLATGSDMAGSIRIPAAMQGLYGYKPPFGRLAPTPGEELFSFAVEGPMARTFPDLLLMQNAIAGPHPASYAGMPATPLPLEYPSLSGYKIAYAQVFGGAPVAADIEANLKSALQRLVERGARIESVDLPFDSTADAYTLLESIFGLFFNEYIERYAPDELSRATSYTRLLAERYRQRKCSIMAAAQLATRMHRLFEERVWSRGYYVLICPTLYTNEMPADLDITRTPTITINGAAVDSYLGWLGTPLFNLLSRYPALAVPTGLAKNGVPTSMQIVGRPFDDRAVFHVAHEHAQADTTNLYRSTFPKFVSAPRVA